MEENQPYNLPPTSPNLTEQDVRAIFYSMMSSFNAPSTIAGSFIQSKNFVTGVSGWQLGSNSAEIAGWRISSATLVGGAVTLDSSGLIKITQTTVASGNLRINGNGLLYYVSNSLNASLYLSAGSDSFSTGSLTMQIGPITGGIGLDFNCTASDTGNFSPQSSGDSISLGTSSNYFIDINYKNLIDRGCLGWFDEGVEMRDGTKLSDVEAIKSIKKDTKKNTVYGVPMLDYASMPKAVFKEAPIADKDIYDNRDKKKLVFKKGEKIGVDGAETTALISIMIGAIKELAGRVEILEAEVKDLKSKKT